MASHTRRSASSTSFTECRRSTNGPAPQVDHPAMRIGNRMLGPPFGFFGHDGSRTSRGAPIQAGQLCVSTGRSVPAASKDSAARSRFGDQENEATLLRRECLRHW